MATRLACLSLLFLAGCNPFASYPYPECAEIVDWLHDNANDPNSIEITKWSREWPPKPPNNSIYIEVTYRSNNAFGAKVLRRHLFHFANGHMSQALDSSRLDPLH